MKIGLKLGVVAASICVGGAANAGIYASNPVYAGNAPGAIVTCRIFNTSLFNVSVATRQIFDNSGTSVALGNDSCTATLAPVKSCSYSTTVTGNFSFVCRALTSGTDGNITGTAEIQTGASTFITTPFARQ